jgi:hypothetical protein
VTNALIVGKDQSACGNGNGNWNQSKYMGIHPFRFIPQFYEYADRRPIGKSSQIWSMPFANIWQYQCHPHRNTAKNIARNWEGGEKFL